MDIALMERHKLNLKAKFKSGSSYFSFKRIILGVFNVGLIGSICTALPWTGRCHPPPRGLHSFTFRLNVITFCGCMVFPLSIRQGDTSRRPKRLRLS